MQSFYSTKGSQGTGMGLAMVYGIVKRHNGELPVESTPGSGTTVTMKLPLTQEIYREADKETSSLSVQPMKIRIIDDDGHVGGASVGSLSVPSNGVILTPTELSLFQVFFRCWECIARKAVVCGQLMHRVLLPDR